MHKQHLNSEGQNIPSVSEISGIFKKDLSGFEQWICKGLHTKEEKCCVAARNKYYQESANLGHDVHALREAFLKGESFKDGIPEYQGALFDPIARFYKDNGYKPLQIKTSIGDSIQGTEFPMTGKNFGGTLDGCGTFSVAFWENRRKTFWDIEPEDIQGRVWPTFADIWIDDLKIKSEIDITSPLQLYGYRLLLKEVYNIEANWGLIIRRNKKLEQKPQIQLKAYYLPAYSELWNAAFKCYRFLNE